jgi:hypothetical protein
MNQKTRELIEIGLRGIPLENLVDNWIFHVEEISSNVYLVEGINKNGKKVRSYGTDPEKVLNTCLKNVERINARKNIFRKFIKLFSKS